uniref:Uncharacterized protein n=1 Tax=Onchocerca volvulus TaxID=6282 RepID=A0A8R1XRL5_ONCVO
MKQKRIIIVMVKKIGDNFGSTSQIRNKDLRIRQERNHEISKSYSDQLMTNSKVKCFANTAGKTIEEAAKLEKTTSGIKLRKIIK